MLEAQKRKERILNQRKNDVNDIDRETGSIFRGTAARNRSSRLDGDAGHGSDQAQQRSRGGGVQAIKIPDNYQLPPQGKFDRPQVG